MYVKSIGKKLLIGVGDIHPDGQNFKYFVDLSKQKCVKAPIFNLIQTKLHRIHGRMVVNACVEYREEMFIGVGDIHLDGQHFQIFCQFEQTKMAISRPF